MKQLIEFCEDLLDDDEIELTEKTSGELRRWVELAKKQIARRTHHDGRRGEV